jgi:hypothetical protein
MHFSEPVTTLTDYLLGTVGLLFAVLLFRSRPQKRISTRLWSFGFFASAVAAFVGGTYHALKFDVDASVLRSLWSVTICSIGACGAFMVSGVLISSIRRTDESRAWLRGGLLLTLAGVVVQQTGFRSDLDFNHNDIYHIMQTVALYLFFRGARLLEDGPRREF